MLPNCGAGLAKLRASCSTVHRQNFIQLLRSKGALSREPETWLEAPMLRACMIDGFGWFQTADYRRAWLFFDEVDYVLPRPGSGPLFFPAWVSDSPEFRAAFPELSKEDGERVIEAARGDAADLEFRTFVEHNIPMHDRQYATKVVQVYHDGSALGDAAVDPVIAIAVLLNRLLIYSAQVDAIPIVGRRYAATLLRRKLDRWSQLSESKHPIATRSQGQIYAG